MYNYYYYYYCFYVYYNFIITYYLKLLTVKIRNCENSGGLLNQRISTFESIV